jgi:hypothetical protein
VIGYYPTFTGETPAAFTDAVRLNLQGRGFTTGTGAGTTTGGTTPGTGGGTPWTDATTLGGYTAAQLRDRATHTGPFYCQWYFPNELSGVVWRGSVNGSLWRLKANDEVPAERTLDLEQYAGAVAGDVLLASGSAGVVLCRRGVNHAYFQASCVFVVFGSGRLLRWRSIRSHRRYAARRVCAGYRGECGRYAGRERGGQRGGQRRRHACRIYLCDQHRNERIRRRRYGSPGRSDSVAHSYELRAP